MKTSRIVASLFLIVAAGSAHAAGSSFQRSCSSIQLQLEQYNAWIVADCKNGYGGIQNSRVAIEGIENRFGQLRYESSGTSSFQRSCREAWLEWSHDAVWLHAYCGDGNGGERKSSIEIRNIENQHGWLIRK
nr:CVNH domain-containing protein [uncultured Cohaesibacter sp.]